MIGLRSVTVLEHEWVAVHDRAHGRSATMPDDAQQAWLTPEEAQALLRLNAQRPGFCQASFGGIKLAQYCGIVRLPTCIVEVLPKVSLDDDRAPEELRRSRGTLLRMLHSADTLALTILHATPQSTTQAPLLDVFIETFLNFTLDQARRGLLFRYVQESDGLRTLRGRFNSREQARHSIVRPHLLQCDFDAFTADNPYNQAVRATLQSCRAWISRAHTQRLWFEAQACLAGVSLRQMTGQDVARLARDRTTRHYEPLLRWCQWLLSLDSPGLRSGLHEAPGLLFDMNTLFENIVSVEVEASVGDDLLVQRQAPARYLAHVGETQGVFLMAPDITVATRARADAASRIVRIVDAKWKRLTPSSTSWGVGVDDIYQMLAYALRYQCRHVELVYPMPEHQRRSLPAPPCFSLPGNGPEPIEVSVRTLAL